jgi:hypothetical protein
MGTASLRVPHFSRPSREVGTLIFSVKLSRPLHSPPKGRRQGGGSALHRAINEFNIRAIIAMTHHLLPSFWVVIDEHQMRKNYRPLIYHPYENGQFRSREIRQSCANSVVRVARRDSKMRRKMATQTSKEKEG